MTTCLLWTSSRIAHKQEHDSEATTCTISLANLSTLKISFYCHKSSYPGPVRSTVHNWGVPHIGWTHHALGCCSNERWHLGADSKQQCIVWGDRLWLQTLSWCIMYLAPNIEAKPFRGMLDRQAWLSVLGVCGPCRWNPVDACFSYYSLCVSYQNHNISKKNQKTCLLQTMETEVRPLVQLNFLSTHLKMIAYKAGISQNLLKLQSFKIMISGSFMASLDKYLHGRLFVSWGGIIHCFAAPA